MPMLQVKPPISVNSQIDNWISRGQADHSDLAGHCLGTQAREDCVCRTLVAPVIIDADTILRCDTDRNTATLNQIFVFTSHAGYNVNIKSGATTPLCSHAVGQTLVFGTVQIAC